MYFGTFIVTVSVIVLNMIIAVFIEKTAEVLREQIDEMRRKSAKDNHRDEFDILPSPDLTTVYDGILDVDWKEMRRCVFMLYG